GTAALARIAGLARKLQPAGELWVIYPKGIEAIREIDVIEAGRAAGLKDTKGGSFSSTHTGLRFTLPLAAREGAWVRKAPPLAFAELHAFSSGSDGPKFSHHLNLILGDFTTRRLLSRLAFATLASAVSIAFGQLSTSMI